VIRRQDCNERARVTVENVHQWKQDTGTGIAPDRLEQHGSWRLMLQAGKKVPTVVGAGHHEEPVAGDQSLSPPQCMLDHRALAQEGAELLGSVGADEFSDKLA
jgi:hypothetical protein